MMRRREPTDTSTRTPPNLSAASCGPKSSAASRLAATSLTAIILSGCPAPAAEPSEPPPPTEAARDGNAQLDIEVTGLAVGQGYVRLAVIDRAENWKAAKDPVAAILASVTAATMRFTLHDVRPGRMAIRLFQDENGNEKLDRNLVGIPIEGYGFSGQLPSMGPPQFNDASFNLTPAGVRIKVEIQ